MTVLRVCYKHGVRFDEGYYTAKHLPLVAGVFGPHGVRKVEMVKFDAAPYQVMFSGYFDSPQALQNALKDPRTPEVMADIAKFYDGMPDVLTGEVVALP
ncbi:MAG TPA: EthD family reductase [Vicinamibacterales bacterium]|nr:EthD family reductase [Vicinamibacterales bacterium]